jgi:hypothetical protein
MMRVDHVQQQGEEVDSKGAVGEHVELAEVPRARRKQGAHYHGWEERGPPDNTA